MAGGSTDAPAGGLPGRRRGRAVSEDLRALAVAAVLHEGMSRSAAGRRFGVSANSVRLWLDRFRERGHVRPDRQGVRPLQGELQRERILRILKEQPDISMYGLSAALAAEGAPVSPWAAQRFLKRHGLDRESRRARQRGRGKGGGR
ncbi:MAG: transposase [Alphaproteobacteria bacterium]|nr:transposase [Alphaproteobacteria bacterium]